MKNRLLKLFFFFTFISTAVHAETPTESLKSNINGLLNAVTSNRENTDKMYSDIATIVRENVDFDSVSKRVISKPWNDATDEQQKTFIDLFSKIMIDTYFSLLKNYNNEEVIYENEQIKKDKYAIVDTQIVSDGKSIPVRYRLLKDDKGWKIYDFVVEGVSIVSSYKTSYEPIVRKSGMAGLLAEMQKPKETQENN